jgi:hypothetical protein
LSLAGESPAPSVVAAEEPARRPLGFATLALAALLAWLPLQTPLAIVVFQYGHAEVLARAMLLAKDAFVAVLILYFVARYWRRLQFYWFDWAAVAYVALIGVYSLVPWLLGSQIAAVSVAASARELLVPVELYALGRLALVAGADVHLLVKWFLAVAAVAAAFTVYEWAFLPETFWSSTLDLVSFIRIVQGVPNARNLWEISILAQFAAGASAVFPRAVGPFTHPVGAGHYFVLPVVLACAWFYQSVNLQRPRTALAIGVVGILFAGAVFAPISRGAWIAVGLALLLCSLIYRRRALIVVAIVLTGALFLAVPSVNHSILAVISGKDASSQDHAEALDRGVRTLIDHPVGMGVGQSDQFGQVLATGDSAGAGVGENMYITLWISTGPLGLLVFLAWLAGLLWHLAFVRHRAPPPSWIVIGTGTALVGYAVTAMLAAPLMRFTTSASVWLVVGLCAGLVLASSRSEKDREAISAGASSSASAS